MSGWYSTPTREEKAAAAADRLASRDSIQSATKKIQDTLAKLKKDSAKEDYETVNKIYKDGLDWLKAHPTTSPDDITDYMTKLTSIPLLQTYWIRKNGYDLFSYIEKTATNRIKELTEKRKELVPTANELLTPALAYRDKILAWFKNGQMTLITEDYEDKRIEILEHISGSDRKGDTFNIKAFLDDKELEKLMIKKQAEDNTFDKMRFTKKIFKYVGISLLVVILVWGFFLGACYSTNLNIYRSFNFRVFYALYGALFWIFVVPYEVIYKKWWLNEPLKMQGYIPLFDGPVANWSWFGKNFLFFFEKKMSINMEA